eukprot:3935597-Rhodomonas_salina.4
MPCFGSAIGVGWSACLVAACGVRCRGLSHQRVPVADHRQGPCRSRAGQRGVPLSNLDLMRLAPAFKPEFDEPQTPFQTWSLPASTSCFQTAFDAP